jgi:hypothetical protein
LQESKPLWRAGRGFVVRDLPWTVEKLRVIPPFEFENWAVIALGGIPNKVQVGDMGVDGRIFPASASATGRPPLAERAMRVYCDRVGSKSTSVCGLFYQTGCQPQPKEKL